MSYRHFEQLVIGVGALAILGPALLTLRSGFSAIELFAQVLLFIVLVCAVHWGRRGGFIAAAIASLVYVAVRVPLMTLAGLTPDVYVMLVSRIAAFGLVGIGGGEIFSRIMYFFARLEDSNAIDDWSGVYNQRFAARQLQVSIGRCTRYGEPFSLLLLKLSDSLLADLRSSRQRSLVRAVANHIREDVRMVDEVARLADGTFLVLFPHTPKDGAIVAAERVGRTVRTAIGARDEAVKATVLGCAQDAEQIDALLTSISPTDDDQDSSSSYSSDASSTRNPADSSTSSAPAASTLNMSTAAAPEGSTKQ